MAKPKFEYVAVVRGKRYTVDELRATFDLVADKKHWKNPIKTKPLELTDTQIELINEAVIFFTGSVPHFEYHQNGKVSVTARGYFLTIGA